MRILDLGGLRVAAGLSWALYDSPRDARAALKGKKIAASVLRNTSGEWVQAAIEEEAAKAAGKLPQPLYAGAILLALLGKDVIAYHDLGDEAEHVWLCAIRDGVPLPGLDAVVPAAQAQAMLGEALGYIPGATLVGTAAGAAFDLPGGLQRLAKRDLGQAGMRMHGLQKAHLVGAVAAALAAAAALGGWQYYEHWREQQELAQLQAHMSAQAAAQAAAQQQQLQAKQMRLLLAQQQLEQQAEAARQTFLDGPQPAQQYALWLQALSRLPLSVRGWIVSSAQCDVQQCQVTFGRYDVRAEPSATALLPGSEVSTTSDVAVRAFAIGQAPQADERLPALTQQALDDWVARLGWIKGASFAVQPASDVLVQPPADAEGLQPVVIGREGTWTLKSDDLLQARKVLESLHWRGVVVTSARFAPFKAGAAEQVEITGRYRLAAM